MTAEDDDPGIDATDLAIAELLADAEMLPYSTGNGYESMERCPWANCSSGWHFRDHAHFRPKVEPTPFRPVIVEERPDITVDLASVDTAQPPPLLVDRLDPAGHTILYGTGGVGKGALASWWIVRLVRTGHRVLVVDYEGHPEEWARRISSLAPDVLPMGAVRHVAPKEPLARVAGDMAAACDEHRIDYIVVDSAVMACGADPLKPETAANYAAAVLAIGRPTLTLAHVTKLDDLRYPFGSIFWHNLARMTWSLAADGDDVILRHRKHNNYRSSGSFKVVATWTETGLMEVWDSKSYAQSILDRAMDCIPNEGATLHEIRADLNDGERKDVSVDSLRRTLARAIPEKLRLSGERYTRSA